MTIAASSGDLGSTLLWILTSNRRSATCSANPVAAQAQLLQYYGDGLGEVVDVGGRYAGNVDSAGIDDVDAEVLF